MKIDVRHEGELCILNLSGHLTYPDATSELQRMSKELTAAGKRFFILNMLDVPWLDSCGMGEVVACYKRARENGGLVKLVLEKRPYLLFTYCHLEKMFELFHEETDAVASFA